MLYKSSKDFKYDVALTFSGILRPQANELKRHLEEIYELRVFCETDTHGKNYDSVVSGYATESVLIVSFFSKEYGYSDFCQEEWHKIKEHWDVLYDRVLPVRFDDSSPGYAVSKQIGVVPYFGLSQQLDANTGKESKIIDYEGLSQVINNKLQDIKISWRSTEFQACLTVAGDDVDSNGDLEEYFKSSYDSFFSSTYSKIDFIPQNHKVFVDTFSDLIVIADSKSFESTLVQIPLKRIAKARNELFKNTLFLVSLKQEGWAKAKKDKEKKKLIENFEKDFPEASRLFLLPDSLGELNEYLGIVSKPICNVFFDNANTFDIKMVRQSLHSKFSDFSKLASAIRWYDLSLISQQPHSHCAMLDSACSSPYTNNIYLISADFSRLTAEIHGHPENSSVLALLPRIISLRSNNSALQTFCLAQHDAERILSDPSIRKKLVNYWYYAKLSADNEPAALKTRLSSYLK